MELRGIFSRPWVRICLVLVGLAACVYGMIYVDLVLRARAAYREGEKYLGWHQHPEEKEKYFRKQFEEKKQRLDKARAKGRITDERYEEDIDLARFEMEQSISESSVKYAHVWYQTAVELFSPPESRWVRLSRDKMIKARAIWKEELRKKNIPFEDYMLE